MSYITEQEPRRYQCRHIFTDGHRCGSPSLRNENFCYYHHTTRRPKQRSAPHDPFLFPPNETNFVLPRPEDRSAIQHSIGEIMNQLAGNALDPRRAGLLLYALQIASLNLKTERKTERSHQKAETVDEVTIDPEFGPLAPIAEVGENEPKSSVRLLVEQFERESEERKARQALTLQASAEPAAPVQTAAARAPRPRSSPVPSPDASPDSSPDSSPIFRRLYEKVPRGGVPHRTSARRLRYSNPRTHRKA